MHIRLLALALLLIAPRLSAQVASAPRQVVVTGRGEVNVAPDKAAILLAVQTRAATAAEAGADNARRITAIRAALQGIEVPPEAITTAGYSVQPHIIYREGQEDRQEGYVAVNTVRVETTRLDQVGRIIDTALGAGANSISSVQFTSSRVAEARRAALAEAVAEARLDAEAIARAGGGALGDLLELSTTGMAPQAFNYANNVVIRGVSNTQTPITPDEIRVEAVVVGRWVFQAR